MSPLEEAFAAAKAEREGPSEATAESTPTETAPPETPAEGEGEGDGTDASESLDKLGTEDASSSQPQETTVDQIEAIRQKVAEGRFGELTAKERALYQAVRSDVQSQIELQERIHNEYLRLYDLRENDPQAFMQYMEQNPKAWQAFLRYQQEYPDAHEGTRPQPTEKQIREQVRGEYSEAVRDTASQLVTDAGLPESRVAELQKEHGNKLGAFLVAAYNESVDAKVEARLAEERPKIAAEEREAVTKELEAKYAERNAVRLPAQGTTGDPGQKQRAPATNIYEAFAQAKEDMGVA